MCYMRHAGQSLNPSPLAPRRFVRLMFHGATALVGVARALACDARECGTVERLQAVCRRECVLLDNLTYCMRRAHSALDRRTSAIVPYGCVGVPAGLKLRSCVPSYQKKSCQHSRQVPLATPTLAQLKKRAWERMCTSTKAVRPYARRPP